MFEDQNVSHKYGLLSTPWGILNPQKKIEKFFPLPSICAIYITVNYESGMEAFALERVQTSKETDNTTFQ